MTLEQKDKIYEITMKSNFSREWIVDMLTDNDWDVDKTWDSIGKIFEKENKWSRELGKKMLMEELERLQQREGWVLGKLLELMSGEFEPRIEAATTQEELDSISRELLSEWPSCSVTSFLMFKKIKEKEKAL